MKTQFNVAAGILPAVEGGILPPGLALEMSLPFEFCTRFVMVAVSPPGWKPGFTAGRMPAATSNKL
jgi:hypothetical protein